MRKLHTNKTIEGSFEELDRYLYTIILADNDMEHNVDKFVEAIQLACNRLFSTTNTGKNRTKNSVLWWTESLTIMRKRVNAHRRLYQRTVTKTGKGENKHI
jgi:hypothetical protein